MVPRSTLGSAISKTEREIERSADGRGRPAVLTNRQVPACLHAVKGSTKGTNVDRCDTLRCTVLILAALSVVRLSTIDYRRRKTLQAKSKVCRLGFDQWPGFRVRSSASRTWPRAGAPRGRSTTARTSASTWAWTCACRRSGRRCRSGARRAGGEQGRGRGERAPSERQIWPAVCARGTRRVCVACY